MVSLVTVGDQQPQQHLRVWKAWACPCDGPPARLTSLREDTQTHDSHAKAVGYLQGDVDVLKMFGTCAALITLTFCGLLYPGPLNTSDLDPCQSPQGKIDPVTKRLENCSLSILST